MCARCDGDIVTKDQIEKAIRMTQNYTEWLNCEAIEKEIANQLEHKADLGEFDGSLKSAAKCLVLAGYELDFKI